MDEINELRNFFLIIIPAAGGIRILMCILAIAGAQLSAEDDSVYRKRIKNTLKFIVLAMIVTGLLTMMMSYIGGSI